MASTAASRAGKAVSTTPTTVLLLGASGQLGNALRQHWCQPQFEGRICQIASRHEAVDIADRAAVREQISNTHPDIIINCAGFTDSRMAENEKEACWRTNVLGTQHLVECCQEWRIDLVHISSDFLYGLDNQPYRQFLACRRAAQGGCHCPEEPADPRYGEQSPAAPIGHLAMTKLAAEHAILQAYASDYDLRAWILRTACLFEPPWRTARNFLHSTATRLASRPEPVPVVNDVYTSICYAPELAQVLAWLVEQRETNWFPRGIYNVANSGAPSLYDIAARLAANLQYPLGRVRPVSSREYAQGSTSGSAVCRRHYTVLNCDRYAAVRGPDMGSWEQAVDAWCQAARDNAFFR